MFSLTLLGRKRFPPQLLSRKSFSAVAAERKKSFRHSFFAGPRSALVAQGRQAGSGVGFLCPTLGARYYRKGSIKPTIFIFISTNTHDSRLQIRQMI